MFKYKIFKNKNTELITEVFSSLNYFLIALESTYSDFSVENISEYHKQIKRGLKLKLVDMSQKQYRQATNTNGQTFFNSVGTKKVLELATVKE